MSRLSVSTVLLTLLVGLSHVPLATAGRDAGGNYSVFPRVVATVITPEPRGMATIRTVDGMTYDVVKGTTWRVGDTVEWTGQSCIDLNLEITKQDNGTLQREGAFHMTLRESHIPSHLVVTS